MKPILQDEVGPAINEPWASAIYFRLASGSCSKNDLIQIEDDSSGMQAGVQADASVIATTKGKLVVSVDAISSGDASTFTALPWRVIPDVNTSGATENDPVYLSDTAGGWSLSAGTVKRVVGRVLKVDATAGIILLDPQGALDGVGESVYADAIVADSTAITNTTTRTAFSRTLSVPANICLAGKTLKFYAAVRATATNGTDTLLCDLEIDDGTSQVAVITGAAVDVADDDVYILEGRVTFRAAPGTAVDVEGYGKAFVDTGAAGQIAGNTSMADGQTLDTTAALTLKAYATWGAASTANSCKLVHFSYELV